MCTQGARQSCIQAYTSSSTWKVGQRSFAARRNQKVVKAASGSRVPSKGCVFLRSRKCDICTFLSVTFWCSSAAALEWPKGCFCPHPPSPFVGEDWESFSLLPYLMRLAQIVAAGKLSYNLIYGWVWERTGVFVSRSLVFTAFIPNVV